jgi:CRP-like cAMP-binding protein
MSADMRDVHAGADIVGDGDWASELSLIIERVACCYKVLADGRRQIRAFLIPGDICDLRS